MDRVGFSIYEIISSANTGSTHKNQLYFHTPGMNSLKRNYENNSMKYSTERINYLGIKLPKKLLDCKLKTTNVDE